MEPTVPSIQDHNNNFLSETVDIRYVDRTCTIQIYNNSLGTRWLEALESNLISKRVLEKNFCFLGWADSKRDLKFLCGTLNSFIDRINQHQFSPAYQKLKNFTPLDFQDQNSLQLKHDACNFLHRYFEDLQGTAWGLSDHYKQAPHDVKYAIRQLNNICHEIEGWVNAYKKKQKDPEWIRPSQITTFLNAPRHDLHEEDYELFLQNRYDRELGGVYLHWSQVGKTLFEVFRDEHAPVMTEALCSEINHQKYYSGEFDIEWGQTVTEDNKFKKEEMDEYRAWLEQNGYDYNDKKLSLGYIKLGQIDITKEFGTESFRKVYDAMQSNLNISSIAINKEKNVSCNYPYDLDSDDWQKIQLEGLRKGYESHRMR